MATFWKGVAGVLTVAGLVIGLIGLVLADTGRLSYYPWIVISGVVAMFSSFAFLVILYAHAVITTSKNDPI